MNFSVGILCLEQTCALWLSTKNTCLLPRAPSCHPDSGGNKEQQALPGRGAFSEASVWISQVYLNSQERIPGATAAANTFRTRIPAGHVRD